MSKLTTTAVTSAATITTSMTRKVFSILSIVMISLAVNTTADKTTDLVSSSVSRSRSRSTNSCTNPSEIPFQFTMKADNYPKDISWKLKEANTANVIVKKDKNHYTKKNFLYKDDSYCVNKKKCYQFVITDEYGDGLCCTKGDGWYRIDYDNQAVGRGNEFKSKEVSAFFGEECDSSSPSEAPSLTPTSKLTCAIGKSLFEFEIKTDRYPKETSWELENVASKKLEFRVNKGEYVDKDTSYESNICLDDKICYQFTIFDSGGDGICCSFGAGSYKVSHGGTIKKAGDKFGLNDVPIFIGTGCPTSFPTSLPTSRPSSRPSLSVKPSLETSSFPSSEPSLSEKPSLEPSSFPSLRPTLPEKPSDRPSKSLEPSSAPTDCPGSFFRLDLMTDDFPEDTSWELININRKSGNNIVYSVESGKYDIKNKLYQEKVCIQNIECYQFIISDVFGDGLCCDGSYSIFYEGKLLMRSGDFGKNEKSIQFGDTCPTTPSPSKEPKPTLGPTPTPSIGPTNSFTPTTPKDSNKCNSDPETFAFQLDLMTDQHPEEISWFLKDTSTRTTVVSNREGSYSLKEELYKQTYCLQIGRCYQFTIQDSYADGVCCSYGQGYYKIFSNSNLIQTGKSYESIETSKEFGVGCPNTIPPTPSPNSSSTFQPKSYLFFSIISLHFCFYWAYLQ